MSYTLNAKAYDYDTQRGPEHLRFSGPAQTLSIKDHLDVKRVRPKPSGDFAGQGKASAKLTRTVTVGTETGLGILEVSSSFPVGATVADVESMITDLGTWLVTASADSLLVDQDINQ